jgi:hypothetical protein
VLQDLNLGEIKMALDLSGFVRRRTIIKIGTKEFEFAELTLADLAEFRAEMQKKQEEFNKKRREQLIETASKIGDIDPMELLKYIDKPVTQEEIDAAMETTEGLGFLVFLSLKPAHEGISRKQVLEIVTPQYAEAISKAIFTPDGDAEKKTVEPRPEQK